MLSELNHEGVHVGIITTTQSVPKYPAGVILPIQALQSHSMPTSQLWMMLAVTLHLTAWTKKKKASLADWQLENES